MIPAVVLRAAPGVDGGLRASAASAARFNLVLLMLFTAGNLLPPQVIITPLYRMYLAPADCPAPAERQRALYDQYVGIIAHPRRLPAGLLHVRAEQLHEDAPEGADRGGARRRGRRSGGSTGRSSCRCASRPLAALATLEVTFIYNDFFWALVLMRTGDQAADHLGAEQPPGASSSPTTTCSPPGPLLVALPTLIVYFVAAEAVHPRPDAGLDQGLSGRLLRPVTRSASTLEDEEARPEVADAASSRGGRARGRGRRPSARRRSARPARLASEVDRRSAGHGVTA